MLELTDSDRRLDSLAFAHRHIGPNDSDLSAMVKSLGYGSVAELIAAAVPDEIRTRTPLNLPEAAAEHEVIAQLRELAGRNRVLTSMLGQGYYPTHVPAVIQRNVLENPAWYTAYTPYQPEISQGRLSLLLAFQTMVSDLTGLPIANASMLDEATAAAEAVSVMRRTSKAAPNAVLVVDDSVWQQTRAVLHTRAEPLGIEIISAGLVHAENPEAELSRVLHGRELFGAVVQYPAADGAVRPLAPICAAVAAAGAQITVATDLLALTLISPPGECGADIAIGSSQRFGVPMGFGGPHAGFLAVRSGLERALPGRIVGVSVDADGDPAYRLARQTREQHIRREKATSNICTAQALLAMMAALYAVYHGPDGLQRIAGQVHAHTADLAAGLAQLPGVQILTEHFFDTLRVAVPDRAAQIVNQAAAAGINIWLVSGDELQISCAETTTSADIEALITAFGVVIGMNSPRPPDQPQPSRWPAELHRKSRYLSHPIFNDYHTETAILRYLRQLSDWDYSLDRGMIPLGSCTMKLNATTELLPITWPEFSDLHPFAPMDQVQGSLALIEQLSHWLADITGYHSVSLQPNAGSQGELAGLLAIRAYHRSRGDKARDICLIPASAHGTNAASAVLAGLRVVVIKTTPQGDIDLADIREKITQYPNQLAAIMVTYPSTHGVFETTITEVCHLIHQAGAQVYIDGANMNALVGLAKFAEIGADVSHLNLHKTFCIPHGGGGPGVGPIGVRQHLAPFLPGRASGGADAAVGPVAAAPYGSAGILPISWAYLRLMGPTGLTRATEVAITSANYLAGQLKDSFPVLFTGPAGLVAHECIIDLRPLANETGITVDDVAKRLMDFGFHAPTMSFPVPGTLMIEPTESENKAELDRFCAAMIAIRAEIAQVAAGCWTAELSPLRGAQHTAKSLVGQWSKPYSREQAVYPAGVAPQRKYWPPVRRIDGAAGDRELVCSCPPVESYAPPAG